MIPADKVIVIPPDAKLIDVLTLIEKTGHIGYPVIENGKLVGIVTFEDIEKVPIEEREEKNVSDVMSKQIIVTYPDETLEDALQKLVNYNIRLPVVDRRDKNKLLGLITRSVIVRAHVSATRKIS